MHFFEIASGRETGDVIRRAWYSSPNWLPDNRSLVYSKLQKLPPGAPATEIEQKVRSPQKLLLFKRSGAWTTRNPSLTPWL